MLQGSQGLALAANQTVVPVWVLVPATQAGIRITYCICTAQPTIALRDYYQLAHIRSAPVHSSVEIPEGVSGLASLRPAPA